ncbi:MAG: hypothetical protein FJ009_03150 [Chloroflexi bacterium]|nr:hypothetical protein [Chloroflexota bacterium]
MKKILRRILGTLLDDKGLTTIQSIGLAATVFAILLATFLVFSGRVSTLIDAYTTAEVTQRDRFEGKAGTTSINPQSASGQNYGNSSGKGTNANNQQATGKSAEPAKDGFDWLGLASSGVDILEDVAKGQPVKLLLDGAGAITGVASQFEKDLKGASALFDGGGKIASGISELAGWANMHNSTTVFSALKFNHGWNPFGLVGKFPWLYQVLKVLGPFLGLIGGIAQIWQGWNELKGTEPDSKVNGVLNITSGVLLAFAGILGLIAAFVTAPAWLTAVIAGLTIGAGILTLIRYRNEIGQFLRSGLKAVGDAMNGIGSAVGGILSAVGL